MIEATCPADFSEFNKDVPALGLQGIIPFMLCMLSMLYISMRQVDCSSHCVGGCMPDCRIYIKSAECRATVLNPGFSIPFIC